MKNEPLLRKQILTDLEKHLSPARYQHTLGVEETAVEMARHFGVSAKDASIAALLHDNAKYMSPKALLKLCGAYPEEMKLTEDYAVVLHAFAGAVRAQEYFEGLSEDILQAICYHTTGRPAMSQLEKVIFIADYTEPGRKFFEGLDVARKLAFQDLDACMLFILKQTIDYVKSKENAIHPLTVEAYDYYKRRFPNE